MTVVIDLTASAGDGLDTSTVDDNNELMVFGEAAREYSNADLTLKTAQALGLPDARAQLLAGSFVGAIATAG